MRLEVVTGLRRMMLTCGASCAIGAMGSVGLVLESRAQEPAAAQQTPAAAPSRSITAALDAAVAGQEHLGEAMREVRDRIVRTDADATKLIGLFNSWDLATALKRSETTSQLEVGLGLLEHADNPEIEAKIIRETLAKSLEFADALIADPQAENQRELIFILQWLALGESLEGGERIVRAARAGIASDERLWPIVFDPYSKDSATARKVISDLTDPIPAGSIGLGILDCANALRLEGVEIKHPFDSDAGVAKLAEWLKTPVGEAIDPAQSAAAALPFLTHPQRNPLLQQAVNHEHPLVKAEAGWALVMLEDLRGIRLLQAVCRDVRYSITAQIYLEDLEAEDQIPPEVKEPDFAVRAEFCHFLALPDQVGEAPDEITVLGSQVLFWPPTNDRRRMSVVRFVYKDDAGAVEREGVGVVGNLTAWLPDKTNVAMPPGNVLALHCAYELYAMRDPRAPAEITAEAGMAIIKASQPPAR